MSSSAASSSAASSSASSSAAAVARAAAPKSVELMSERLGFMKPDTYDSVDYNNFKQNYLQEELKDNRYMGNIISHFKDLLFAELKKTKQKKKEKKEIRNIIHDISENFMTVENIELYRGPPRGGVQEFWEALFNFNLADKVRGIFERKPPPQQCESSYKDKLEMVERDSDMESAGRRDIQVSGSVKDKYRDSMIGEIRKKAKQLFWKTNEESFVPVTCYICDRLLYKKYGRKDQSSDTMECEHYFPFLEAQLLWGLNTPNIEWKDELRTGEKREEYENYLKKLSREYGPVCSRCNGRAYKSGRTMIKLNEDWKEAAEAAAADPEAASSSSSSNPFVLHMDNINHISKRGKERNSILNENEIKQRLKNVFEPLLNTICLLYTSPSPRD